MAFWKDEDTPEPLRSHRWYIQFSNNTPSFKDIKFALKECKKPDYEINVTEHKRLNHVVRLPGILKWKPITVKFASIRNRDYTLDASSIIYSATKNGGYSSPVSFLEAALSKYKMHDALEKNALNIIQVDADGKPIEVWSLFKAIITSVNFGNLNYESEDIVNIECTITYDYAELNNSQRVNNLKIEDNSSNEISPKFNQQDQKLSNGLGKAKASFGKVEGDLKPLDFYQPKDPNWTNKAGNPVVVTSSIISDVEYDKIPPDRFDRAIKLVTAKDANDLGRLIKISRADNRSTSRDLSGQYNEFNDATDGDTGLIFSNVALDPNSNPLITEEQIRNEQFAEEEAQRQAARSQAEEQQLRQREQQILEEANIREQEALKTLVAQQEAEANKDSVLLDPSNPEDAKKIERNMAENDRLAEAKNQSTDLDLMAKEAESQRYQQEAVTQFEEEFDGVFPEGPEYKPNLLEPEYTAEYNSAALNDSSNLQVDTDLESALQQSDLQNEGQQIVDSLYPFGSSEQEEGRIEYVSQAPSSPEISPLTQGFTDGVEGPPESLPKYPYEETNVSSNQLANNTESNYDIYDNTPLQKQNYVESSSSEQEALNDTQQVIYGPETPSEEEWAQMNTDKRKREIPNLLGDLGGGKSASEAFEGVSAQEEATQLETGPKGGSSGEIAKAGSVKSTSNIDSAYDDDIIGSSGPKIESYKDESVSASNKYNEATIPTVVGEKFQVKERVESIEDIEKIEARLQEINRQYLEAIKTATKEKDYATVSRYQDRTAYERELLKARKSELEKKKN